MAEICELIALFIGCVRHAAACTCCWTGAKALQRAQGLRTATAASPAAKPTADQASVARFFNGNELSVVAQKEAANFSNPCSLRGTLDIESSC